MGQVTPPLSSPPPAGTILATDKPSRGMLDIIPINIIYKLIKTYFSPLLSEIDLIHFTQTCIALFNLRLHQGILPSLTLKVLPPANESLVYTINEKLPIKDKEDHWVPWVCRRVGKTVPFLQRFTLHLVPIANKAELANFTQKLGTFVKLITLNLHFIDEQAGSKTTEDYLLILFSLKNLSTLNTLTLNSQSLTQLPKELSLLPSLKVLDLSGCSSLATLSEEFNKNTQIEILLPPHLQAAPTNSQVGIPLALPLLSISKSWGRDSFSDNASSISGSTRSSERSFYSSLAITEANTATTSSTSSLSFWGVAPTRLRRQSFFAESRQVFQPITDNSSSDPAGIYWRESDALENNNTENPIPFFDASAKYEDFISHSSNTSLSTFPKAFSPIEEELNLRDDISSASSTTQYSGRSHQTRSTHTASTATPSSRESSQDTFPSATFNHRKGALTNSNPDIKLGTSSDDEEDYIALSAPEPNY